MSLVLDSDRLSGKMRYTSLQHTLQSKTLVIF